MYFREGFPNVAYYVPDKNKLSARIPFKCRIVQDAPQFFTESVSGLVDVGTNLQLLTYKPLEYKTGAKVIFNDVYYSVTSITPFIPDPAAQGLVKRRIQVEYLIGLE